MKLFNVDIENFMGARDVRLNLADHTVHLIGGNNDQGKSSIQEAIRFALDAETVRVALKKEYSMLITDGAKDGKVSITWGHGNEPEEVVVRNIRDGKLLKGNIPDIGTLPYVLDASKFSKLDDTKRRRLLMMINNVKISSDMIRDKLEKRGCNMLFVDNILALLRSGFGTAHDEAKKKASEARGAWKAITGEVYGDRKAEDWSPAAAIADGTKWTEEDVQKLRDQEELFTQELNELFERRGSLKSQVSPEEIARLREVAKTHANLTVQLKNVREQIETINRNHLVPLGIQIGNAAKLFCPDCGAPLRMNEEKVLIHDNADDELDLEALLDEQLTYQQQVKVLESKRDGIKDQVDAAESAAKQLENLPEASTNDEEEEETLDDIAFKISEITNKKDQVKSELEAAEEHLGEEDRSREAIRVAKQYHHEVQDWSKIADALDTGGIPAELLSQSLAPINRRLQENSSKTGWPLVQILPSMQITSNGRPYQLLGESSRWRADTMITEAIAHIIDFGLLVLDRIDVLDLSSRTQLLNWINSLRSSYDTILLFGTLKRLPQKLPPGFATYWIENGVIQEKSSA